MNNRDTGLLLNEKNIKLHRTYFKEMVKLLGINVIHRAPREDKTWDRYGELDSFYYEPVMVGVIFDEHPEPKTMKLLGWNAEQEENMSIVHVPYDLEKIQAGSLFVIPGGVDGSEGRLFRVIRMSTTFVYPASIACEIAPEYKSTFAKAQLNFENSDFNLLHSEE